MGEPLPEVVSNLVEFLRELLKELDVGDCNSGGDYHLSRLGRHCDENGGKDTCPACRIRREITEAGYNP